MITMLSRFQKRGKLLFIIILAWGDCLCQNYSLIGSDNFPPSVLNGKGLWSFFNDIVENDPKSKLQILFIQLGDRKLANSYYLRIDENNQKLRITFSRDSILQSGLITNSGIDSFFSASDSSYRFYIMNNNSATDSYGTISSYFVLKEKNKSAKVMFVNTPVEKAVNSVIELYALKKAFGFLEKNFKIRIHRLLDK